MHKDYWIAIGLYILAVLMIALPFLGIVTIQSSLSYSTLKYVHIVAVMLVVSALFGQLIAFVVMDRSGIITQEAITRLSYLDYVTPVGLIIIGYLGYALAAHFGPIWQTPWIYESSFGLLIYALISLVITVIFRSERFYQEGGNTDPRGVYASVGSGLVIYALITGIMVYKTVPLSTAHHFAGITQYFLGQ